MPNLLEDKTILLGGTNSGRRFLILTTGGRLETGQLYMAYTASELFKPRIAKFVSGARVYDSIVEALIIRGEPDKGFLVAHLRSGMWQVGTKHDLIRCPQAVETISWLDPSDYNIQVIQGKIRVDALG